MVNTNFFKKNIRQHGEIDRTSDRFKMGASLRGNITFLSLEIVSKLKYVLVLFNSVQYKKHICQLKYRFKPIKLTWSLILLCFIQSNIAFAPGVNVEHNQKLIFNVYFQINIPRREFMEEQNKFGQLFFDSLFFLIYFKILYLS